MLTFEAKSSCLEYCLKLRTDYLAIAFEPVLANRKIMAKYEYYITRVDTFVNINVNSILNKFSAEGWDLIAVTPINSNGSTVWVNYTLRRVRE